MVAAAVSFGAVGSLMGVALLLHVHVRGFAVLEVLWCVWAFGGCLALGCVLGLVRWWVWAWEMGSRWVTAMSVAGQSACFG
jgi:hypothetical protein